MNLRKVLALRGPNIWANYPVLEAWLDIGAFHDRPSDKIPGFNERVISWLPTMFEHRCSEGRPGGFFERLRLGTYMGHILEHVVLELQTLAGTEVGFGRTRESHEPGVFKVVIEYKDETLARASLAVGLRLCVAAAAGESFDIAGELDNLRDLAREVCLGPSTAAIVEAAAARGIPCRRLNAESLVQLGQGANQRRICAAETSQTGAIAEAIAQDKELTRMLLAAAGVPVPAGRPVEDAEDAWRAAQELGGAVVVKPRDGNQGRGVVTNLSSRDQILAAYQTARKEEEAVLVERYLPGDDFRLLVVGDRVVAAARREPAQVTGNGRSTIRELVAEVNRDPRRSDGHATVLSKLPLDEIACSVLSAQGFMADSVPPAGAKVLIRRNANLSTGGTATDVTELVHPEVAARAVEAARIVGLDIAGIDVVTQDITRPLEGLGGVVEVNAAPGLRMHLCPTHGKPRPVAEAIIDNLFPRGRNGRIPIVGVTGVNGKTTVTRLIAHLLRCQGRSVGMTCTDGIYINDRRIDDDDCSGPQSAQTVLMNPTVDAAVLETARGGILRAGLGFDRCDVAVVTNIGEGDHLGLGGVETLEELVRVKRVLVEAVAPGGSAVLNADDPLAAGMASRCPGSVIYFAMRHDHPEIVRHRAAGGRAVFLRVDTLIFAEAEVEIPVASLRHVPLTHGGRIRFQVENVLAASAAAWALGLHRDVIRSALESFEGSLHHSPGRFNVLSVNGATVVVDYGHNASALAALIASLGQFPFVGWRVVYSTAGDRREMDIVRQGELLGEAFDRVILYEDHYTRGRAPGEIISLLRSGIGKGKRVVEVQEIQGALAAVRAALEVTEPGELLLVQADTIDETVDFIRRFLAENISARETDLGPIVAPPAAKPLRVMPAV